MKIKNCKDVIFFNLKEKNVIINKVLEIKVENFKKRDEFGIESLKLLFFYIFGDNDDRALLTQMMVLKQLTLLIGCFVGNIFVSAVEKYHRMKITIVCSEEHH